ncbi:ATP-binding protein [Bradyrhizobium sp. OK095]|uniref:ATP-binding protein n=1 Tax=Bradyrhizobium sp. OK095 TaxID=1882760 RepID=UPI0008CFAB35|nr:ATP-binding protein [Bradyrhizobium sp. OK095]SEN57548.1 hypothetical protein SAMN05443254_109195 [Bradyrhizobium sp. OK095]
MSSPADKAPDSREFLKLVEAWKRTIASLGTTIASAGGSFFKIPEPANQIAAFLIAGVGLLISFLIYRRDARQHTAAKQKKTETSTAAGAFRGLRRFLRGDELPGSVRRVQAIHLAREIERPDFKIALVTGDSGVGKSSLLECALVKKLEELGHSVAMISNSAELGLSHAAAPDHVPRIEDAIAEIGDRMSNFKHDKKKPTIVILDQFEELLSRFRNASDRKLLSDGLWKIVGEGNRIIVGIRKEYLIDFKTISLGPDYIVSFKDTFLVENLETNEAEEIIRECAKQDHLEFDQDLPELIANDLAIEGKVRPADLQIVCTALSGDLTVERYRSAGRAAGLRSKFVKGVIDITGDAILARAVLRQLCDIPNNKKAEPARAEEITEKAKAGAAGERATLKAINSILREMEQARVLTRIDNKNTDDLRWSLIHDYLVEPIKIATEEQNTRSETAAARLDYFVTRAKIAGGVIPRPDLHLIRRDAPPAALQQPDARILIRRSLIVGYGVPVAAIGGAIFLGVVMVIAAATTRVWQIVDENNHFDRSAATADSFRYVKTTTANVATRPDRRTVLVSGTGMESSRVTAWDFNTGAFLGSGFGFVTDDSIWNYDPATGHLTRLNIDGTASLDITTPQESRPNKTTKISSFKNPFVNFETFETFAILFDTKNKKWISIDYDNVSPSRSVDTERSDSAFLTVVTGQDSETSRVTLWTTGFGQRLLDQRFNSPVRDTRLIELGTRTILSFAREKSLNTIVIDRAAPGNGASFSVGEARETPLPADMPPGLLNQPAESRAQTVVFGDRMIFPDLSPTRTIFWIFNLRTLQFEPPEIAAQTARIEGPMEGYAWMPEDSKGQARIWVEQDNAPRRIEGLQIRFNDRILISRDRQRLIVISKEGSVDLWSIDLDARKARMLARLEGIDNSDWLFSEDDHLMIRRRPGGIHELWGTNGTSLGQLGPLGSQIQTSSYQADCRQTFVWTTEGQRLEFRRGFNIPLIGFVPERDCPLKSSSLQNGLAKMFAYVVD